MSCVNLQPNYHIATAKLIVQNVLTFFSFFTWLCEFSVSLSLLNYSFRLGFVLFCFISAMLWNVKTCYSNNGVRAVEIIWNCKSYTFDWVHCSKKPCAFVKMYLACRQSLTHSEIYFQCEVYSHIFWKIQVWLFFASKFS